MDMLSSLFVSPKKEPAPTANGKWPITTTIPLAAAKPTPPAAAKPTPAAASSKIFDRDAAGNDEDDAPGYDYSYYKNARPSYEAELNEAAITKSSTKSYRTTYAPVAPTTTKSSQYAVATAKSTAPATIKSGQYAVATAKSTAVAGDEKEGTGLFTPATMLLWLHGLLVIVLTGLMATLYSGNGRSASQKGILEGWVVAPTRCTLWVDGVCVPQPSVTEYEGPTAAALGGQLMEYEGRTTGLLSTVHPAFLCLAMQVLAFALTLKSSSGAAYFAETTGQVMKHISLVVIAVYGSLFLFMQSTWTLPINNLLLVECIYVLALFFVGTYSTHDSEGKHLEDVHENVWLVSLVVTLPLMGVSALAASGEDNTTVHLTVFFSLILASFVMVVAILETQERESAGTVYVVLLATFWLCMVPLVLLCCARLQRMLSSDSNNGTVVLWAVITLFVLLIFFLIIAVMASFVVQHLGGLTQRFSMLVSANGLQIAEYLDLLAKITLSLLTIIGIYCDS